MKYYILFLCIAFSSMKLSGQEHVVVADQNHIRNKFYSDSLFPELDAEIAKKDYYEALKIQEIKALKLALSNIKSKNPFEQFKVFEELHLAYFTFDYDSAIFYATKMMDIAYSNQNPKLIALSKIKISSTMLASGIFSEVKDTLNSVQISALDTANQIDYYYLYSRLFFDMADYYQRSYFFNKYVNLGLQYLDSALIISKQNPARYYSLKGLYYVREGNIKTAIQTYQTLFNKYQIKGKQFAIDGCTYAYALELYKNYDEAMVYLARAAIEDIKIANKENVALINLSDLLYNQGYIVESSKYLNVAFDDASQYGALQRKFQISQLQPIIEASKLELSEKQSARMVRYVIAVSGLSLFIIVILIILYVQYNRIRAAKNEINKSYNTLQKTNWKLREVNLINEEYIAKFFETNSDLIDKIESYKQTIQNKVLMNKIDELKTFINNLDINQERDEMYRIFDSVFINIFPDFIRKYNDLFEEKDRIILKNFSEMNTDLRIFALIRLGINDTEKISNILNYSVNTINTYKTKIKNKSLISNEDFENEIMKIQSI